MSMYQTEEENLRHRLAQIEVLKKRESELREILKPFSQSDKELLYKILRDLLHSEDD